MERPQRFTSLNCTIIHIVSRRISWVENGCPLRGHRSATSVGECTTVSSPLQIFGVDLPHQPFFSRFLLLSCRGQQKKGARIVITTKADNVPLFYATHIRTFSDVQWEVAVADALRYESEAN